MVTVNTVMHCCQVCSAVRVLPCLFCHACSAMPGLPCLCRILLCLFCHAVLPSCSAMPCLSWCPSCHACSARPVLPCLSCLADAEHRLFGSSGYLTRNGVVTTGNIAYPTVTCLQGNGSLTCLRHPSGQHLHQFRRYHSCPRLLDAYAATLTIPFRVCKCLVLPVYQMSQT